MLFLWEADFPLPFSQHEHSFSKRSTNMCCFSAQKERFPISLTAVFLISSSTSSVCVSPQKRLTVRGLSLADSV